jgi:threonine dehydrogenase-like Zn-dependent dehydrogenase
VQSLVKAGILSTVGVYPSTISTIPYGVVMQKNLTIKMGNCNHRRYMTSLLRMVSTGIIDPTVVVTQDEPLTDAITAYLEFDQRKSGWTKILLEPLS